MQTARLSLLLSYYSTSSPSAELEYGAIERKHEEAFLLAFEQIKAFARINASENAIDYLLGRTRYFPACKQSLITIGLPYRLAFENIAENIYACE